MTINITLLREKYQQGDLNSISSALQTLTNLGVFKFHIEENRRRLLERFDTQDPTTLAEEIVKIREENRFLLALHVLGENINKELADA